MDRTCLCFESKTRNQEEFLSNIEAFLHRSNLTLINRITIICFLDFSKDLSWILIIIPFSLLLDVEMYIDS